MSRTRPFVYPLPRPLDPDFLDELPYGTRIVDGEGYLWMRDSGGFSSCSFHHEWQWLTTADAVFEFMGGTVVRDHYMATCLTCGTARRSGTVGRNRVWKTVEDRSPNDAPFGEGDLRCAGCSQVTRHSLDWPPEMITARRKVPAFSSSLEMLQHLSGVTVVEVPNLDVTVCFVAERGVALLRTGLSDAARAKATDWLFGEVMSRAS